VGAVIAVILPVFLLIFLGAFLRQRVFEQASFWETTERLTYYLLFPALLVSTLAGIHFEDLAVGPMAAAIIAALIVMVFVLLALRRPLGINGPAFCSVAQGALRQNSYVGLAVSFGLFGEPGLAAAAVAIIAIVPLVNVLSVSVHAFHAESVHPSLRGVAVALARNPLIIACLLGLAAQLTGLGLPPIVAPVLEILGRAALTLGLLCVGAALDLTAIRSAGRLVAVSSLLKLAVLPALTALACWGLGVGGVAASIAVLFNGLPTATSSYILARLLGGDARLMAGIITLQTALAIVTLPIVLALLP
jgi:hypothetical protein